MRGSIRFVFCRHYTKAAESRFHIFTLTLSPRFMYQYCLSSAGRGNGRGAMPFLMSFALEPEIVTLVWTDNASVQFPLYIYATKGLTQRIHFYGVLAMTCAMPSSKVVAGCQYSKMHGSGSFF